MTPLDPRTQDAIVDSLQVIETAADALAHPNPYLANIAQDILSRVAFIRQLLALEPIDDE